MKLNLTQAAQANVDETGTDPGPDITAIRRGKHTAESLLEYCLDGAEPDREQGWREYVDAVVAAAKKPATYELREDGVTIATVQADSADEALDDYDPEDTGDYDTSHGSVWTTIYATNVDDAGDSSYRKYQIDQDEPECPESDEHDWQSPVEILGGCKENPGVWGHGGGVIIHECCMHCGMQRTTDTWAQDPEDGQQGYTTVTYSEPGHYDLG